MTTIKVLITKYSVPAYYALVFVAALWVVVAAVAMLNRWQLESWALLHPFLSRCPGTVNP